MVAATAEEAARFGDVVLEAIPFGNYQELMSATNYYPQRDACSADDSITAGRTNEALGSFDVLGLG